MADKKNAQIQQEGDNYPYHNPAPFVDGSKTEKQFPIVASGLKYENGSDYLPYDNLLELKTCSFNMCMQKTITTGNESIQNSMNNAETLGLTLLFNSQNLMHGDNYMDKLILNSPYKSGFGGFTLKDEPSEEDIAGNLSLRGDYFILINLTDGKYPILINLLGVQGELKDFTENRAYYLNNYLNIFQNIYRPSFFCYDYYPLSEYISLIYEGINVNKLLVYKEGEVIKQPLYLKNLELFHEYSNSHSRPFWTFIESMCYMNTNKIFYRPKPLEQYLRYQAFTALAYGVQGLIYWAYPIIKTQNDESYISALLDRNNKRTASWYFAQKINQEIQQYHYIFLNSNIYSVSLTTSKRISNVGVILDINTNNHQQVLLSVIKANDNRTYLLIVNDDFLNYQTININILTGSLEEKTPLRSGGPTNQTLTGDNTRILPPGGYRIFLLNSLGPVS